MSKDSNSKENDELNSQKEYADCLKKYSKEKCDEMLKRLKKEKARRETK